MLVSKAEMTALKITNNYMDTSAKMLAGEQGFVFGELLERGYLKLNNDRSCLRLTRAGAEILRCAGVAVKEYVPQSGRVLERRLQGSQVALYLCNLGIDVFLTKMPTSITEPAYLASAELRRQKCSNVLGMSKFLGLLYTTAETYAVYNVSDSAEKFFPTTDEDIFTRELIRANAPAKILYVSEQSLVEMAQTFVQTDSAEKRAEKVKHGCTFYQAIKRFTAPVSLLSLHKSENQMRIMLTEDYKMRLAKFMLDTGCSPVVADFVDAKFADGYFIVFIDFDVKRLEQALAVIKELHILVLTEQLSALEILLKNRKSQRRDEPQRAGLPDRRANLDTNRIETYAIDARKAFEILEIPEPENMNLVQYTTKEGVGVIANKVTNHKTKKHV
jgi:hypothetical protein